MERICFFGGVAGTVGGASVLFYQGIQFLQNGVWNPHSLLSAVGGSLGETVSGMPALMNAMEQCPLSGALVAIGLVLLWMAGRLRNRYA